MQQNHTVLHRAALSGPQRAELDGSGGGGGYLAIRVKKGVERGAQFTKQQNGSLKARQ